MESIQKQIHLSIHKYIHLLYERNLQIEKEVDRLNQKVKDLDNMSDKAKMSLLQYENSFLKEELRNKQLIVEKLLDLKTDKINVQKPSKKSNIHKVNLTHRSNKTNEKKSQKVTKSTDIHNNVIKKSYCDRFFGKIC